ncbi:sulfite exporter TauE/SafE family protein [Salegentibacter sp. JZCK2]|uniref:sulfite exporter TauE/SafE family protein n=1 Tax=Salegentibacter tibetensis TaxID=2873600 RepID=UPI001CCDD888|nr:sulfite exporter TauE/SafE family protein [Salegentibacter tibetensis]MBZ9729042.1 sulfite exporter TauE/SafE family protein [Salegentibacter tibetensis]
MDTDLLFLLGTAIFCGFFVQTVVGFAGSLIALPILLIGLKLPDAIAYISIFYLFSSISLVYKEWKYIDKHVIKKLSITSIIGIVIGILVLTYSQPLILKKALGVFILLYVAYVVVGKIDLKLGNKGTMLFGVLGGFFAGVFSTGGPLYVIAVKNTVENVKIFRATMIGVLALVTTVRLPSLAIGGVLDSGHLKMSLIIFPVFILAQFLGGYFFQKINESLFKKVLLGLLCLSGTALII